MGDSAECEILTYVPERPLVIDNATVAQNLIDKTRVLSKNQGAQGGPICTRGYQRNFVYGEVHLCAVCSKAV